jgi:putative phosphoribosyl transferase
MPDEVFIDRADAGRKLALKLLRFVGVDCVVYGVARGGVIVANEVAHHLDVPLDVVVVRKLGHPGSPEFACGAINAAGDIVLQDSVESDISEAWLDGESKREALEAVRRDSVYMQGREPAHAEGKVAILVDDGIATGMTMAAAVMAVRRLKPASIVVATPVATPATVQRLSELADEVVTVQTPPLLHAVGQSYVDFTQVSDEEVVRCLASSPRERPGAGNASGMQG